MAPWPGRTWLLRPIRGRPSRIGTVFLSLSPPPASSTGGPARAAPPGLTGFGLRFVGNRYGVYYAVPVPGPVGLGDDGKRQSRGGDGHGTQCYCAPLLDSHVGKAGKYYEVGPGQDAGNQTIVPGRTDYQDGPEGPENDGGIQKPVLVVPGLQLFRGNRPFPTTWLRFLLRFLLWFLLRFLL